MWMTDVMEEPDYERKNFNIDEEDSRHPLWMTEAHFFYHLQRNTDGYLTCKKDRHGDPVCSARRLMNMCIYQLVRQPIYMKRLRMNDIPASLYPIMLTEAIFQRELHAVDYLIASWPNHVLNIRDILPLEDYLNSHYLTLPIEGHGSMSLVDCIIMGLLNLTPDSRLRVVDFTGFSNDRKLCRELTRLPILWMRQSDRRTLRVYDILQEILDITQEKVQRYLNRIGCIYSNVDLFVKHGNKLGPVTILLDCKMTFDDVPIGLALQKQTPFRFACRKLWFEPICDVTLPLTSIPKVLDSKIISHLGIEDMDVCANLDRFDNLLEALLLMPNLTVLSLSNTIHTNLHEPAPYELNQVLTSLTCLKRLNFSSCNLGENLDCLLTGLDQQLEYLNIRDCRLRKSDFRFLTLWPGVQYLQELNLGRNNFSGLAIYCVALISKICNITCLSISYCSFSAVALQQIVRKMAVECKRLKVLCIQTFTPLPLADVREILLIGSTIPTLQKCLMLPEIYAFPGRNDETRIIARQRLISFSDQIIRLQGRLDIEVE